jgi:uncharacterized protein (DUF58 family)
VLTRRGWSVVGAVVALLVAGWLLGVHELYAAAVACLAVMAGAVGYVKYYPWKIEAQREVRPPQVHAGGSSRVELSVRNTETRRSPILSARDPFDNGRRWARFHVAPLKPNELVRAAYRLPTGERGIFPLGPLEIGVTDPFGLARRTYQAAPVARLTVYPHIDNIRTLPEARCSDTGGSSTRPSLGDMGEDFYALRPYQTGDDLRRVHWASTARQDELMIRQDELPWEGRVTVFVVLRATVHTPASLELVLSAAASIIHTSWSHHRQVRLTASDGTDTGLGMGHAQLSSILEYLASARLHGGVGLGGVLASLGRLSAGGGLAAVTTDRASDEDLASLNRMTSQYGLAALVLFERSSWDPEALTRPWQPRPGRSRLIRVTAETPFASAWNGTLPAPFRPLGVGT